MKKCKVLILVGGVNLCAGTVCDDELVSMKLGYQLLSPSGEIAGLVNGVGQKVNVENDLNLDDSNNVTAEIAFQWGDSRLSFGYLPIEFSGSGTLTVAGSFNGQAFSISDTVKSDLNIALYDVGFTYYLVNMDDLPTRIQLGLELAVKVADAEITFNDQTANFTETESVTAPIPTVGIRSRIALSDLFGIVGRVGYLEYDNNHFLDAEAQLEFSPIPTVGIYAGYRHFDLEVDESDVIVATKFSGPFAGVFMRF